MNSEWFTCPGNGWYECQACVWRHRSLEDAREHAHREHGIWDCGDFAVRVRTEAARP